MDGAWTRNACPTVSMVVIGKLCQPCPILLLLAGRSDEVGRKAARLEDNASSLELRTVNCTV